MPRKGNKKSHSTQKTPKPAPAKEEPKIVPKEEPVEAIVSDDDEYDPGDFASDDGSLDGNAEDIESIPTCESPESDCSLDPFSACCPPNFPLPDFGRLTLVEVDTGNSPPTQLKEASSQINNAKKQSKKMKKKEVEESGKKMDIGQEEVDDIFAKEFIARLKERLAHDNAMIQEDIVGSSQQPPSRSFLVARRRHRAQQPGYLDPIEGNIPIPRKNMLVDLSNFLQSQDIEFPEAMRKVHEKHMEDLWKQDLVSEYLKSTQPMRDTRLFGMLIGQLNQAAIPPGFGKQEFWIGMPILSITPFFDQKNYATDCVIVTSDEQKLYTHFITTRMYWHRFDEDDFVEDMMTVYLPYKKKTVVRALQITFRTDPEHYWELTDEDYADLIQMYKYLDAPILYNYVYAEVQKLPFERQIRFYLATVPDITMHKVYLTWSIAARPKAAMKVIREWNKSHPKLDEQFNDGEHIYKIALKIVGEKDDLRV